MKNLLIGIDIGGTKCAVVLGNTVPEILHRVEFLTDTEGGPLDSKRGVTLSPPNLPGWDNIPIVSILEKKFGIPVTIQNDANACALAYS